jgi:hypothetical protein
MATDAQRAAVMGGETSVYYAGTLGKAQNGGALVPTDGYGVHLRESAYGSSLMTPSLVQGTATRTVSNLERAMLADVGYSVASLGDMNADGVVNSLDIPDFKAALANISGWETTTGRLANVLGDMNFDGSFNSLDIPAFKQTLAGPSSFSAQAVPEPAALMLVAVALLGLNRKTNHERDQNKFTVK